MVLVMVKCSYFHIQYLAEALVQSDLQKWLIVFQVKMVVLEH